MGGTPASAKEFKRYRLYHPGSSFEGLPLTAAPNADGRPATGNPAVGFILDPVLEQRRARHAQRRAAAATKAAAIDRIAKLAAHVDALDTEALDELCR